MLVELYLLRVVSKKGVYINHLLSLHMPCCIDQNVAI